MRWLSLTAFTLGAIMLLIAPSNSGASLSTAFALLATSNLAYLASLGFLLISLQLYGPAALGVQTVAGVVHAGSIESGELPWGILLASCLLYEFAVFSRAMVKRQQLGYSATGIVLAFGLPAIDLLSTRWFLSYLASAL